MYNIKNVRYLFYNYCLRQKKHWEHWELALPSSAQPCKPKHFIDTVIKWPPPLAPFFKLQVLFFLKSLSGTTIQIFCAKETVVLK